MMATNPNLQSAAFFALFGDTGVVNTGLSSVTGDVGVSSGAAVAGFPPGVVSGGDIHVGDSLAATAHADAQTAYANAAAEPCDVSLTGLDLGGQTVLAGVSCYSAAAALTGTTPLTLDAQGDANAIFVFKIGSTLDTAAGSSVVLANGAQACNVFWQVGGAAGLGASTSFIGTILASTSITSGAGVTNQGGLYALSGAVTLDSNHVTACPPAAATATPTATVTSTPTPILATPTSTATPGSRTASVADLALASIPYSNTAGQRSGTMNLTASDATSAGTGWHVTVQSSAFVYSGGNGGTDITADHFSITQAAAPILTVGELVDSTGGPKVPFGGGTGALDEPRTVLAASPGFGAGTYTQQLGVTMTIPGQSRVGTYTGTITTTIASGP
jgi:hypothetical protein